ncbi:AMP-binding protein [Prescottella equi]
MHFVNLADPDERVVTTILRRQAETVPDQPFLAGQHSEYSYGQVWERSRRYAGALADLGVGRGDTVAMFMDNSPEMAITAFGANQSGAIWSPVSTEYRGEWLQELLQDIRSRVLFVDAHLLPTIANLAEISFDHLVVNGDVPSDLSERIPGVSVHRMADFAEHDEIAVSPDWYYGDTNSILWTSGTTGRSKGVEQPHNAWVSHALHHNEIRGGVREGENFYGCVPMYNSSGWSMNIYAALVTGAKAGIDKRFSVREYWDRIKYFNAHHTMMLGTMHVFLAQQEPTDAERENTLRTLVMNPVVPDLVETAKQRWGIETVFSGYGQSEVLGAVMYRDDWGLKPSACGRPSPDDLVETALLDEHDREVGVGEVGEFCVRPRQPFTMFNGYFNAPDKTAEAFRNLWYHTGDLGRKDADGEMFFVDRKKDSLRFKGRNLSSFEVEHIARGFPGALDTAAVGIQPTDIEYASQLHEAELLLYVLVEPGTSIAPLDLCRYIDEHAPYFFVPRYISQVDEFPMTPTNKVQKYKLRDKGLPENVWDRLVEAPDWNPTR